MAHDRREQAGCAYIRHLFEPYTPKQTAVCAAFYDLACGSAQASVSHQRKRVADQILMSEGDRVELAPSTSTPTLTPSIVHCLYRQKVPDRISMIVRTWPTASSTAVFAPPASFRCSAAGGAAARGAGSSPEGHGLNPAGEVGRTSCLLFLAACSKHSDATRSAAPISNCAKTCSPIPNVRTKKNGCFN